MREIGPGVTMTINTVAREVLGDGQAAADDKLLHTLRDVVDHLNANDGPALRTRQHGAAGARRQAARASAPATARRPTASRRRRPAWTRSACALTKQLSNTEDADIAKTMIDFNSQSAAYQAALRAGANIVQSSLMDFLR